jgi:hypothetical protein
MPDNQPLKNCPFCGKPGTKTFCCGAAIPNCPRCSDLFGCAPCDIWVDTAEEWNTRVPDTELIEAAEKKRPSEKLPPAEYVETLP